jgi:hypothetical protein
VDWYIDDRLAASTTTGEYSWNLQGGVHSVKARLRQAGEKGFTETRTVSFMVK